MSKLSNVIGGAAGVAGFLVAYSCCPGSEVGKTAAGTAAGVVTASIVDGAIDITTKAIKGVVKCVDFIVGADPEIEAIKKKYASVNTEDTDTVPDVDTTSAEPPQVQEEQPQPDGETSIPGSVADVLIGNG